MVEGKEIKHLYELSGKIRGEFLDQAIWIETFMTDIISWHFCPEESRRSLLFPFVSSKLTFSAKAEIFENVLKQHYPDQLEKHPKLMPAIEKTRALRNEFAHSLLDASDDFFRKGYTDRIRLLTYKRGKKKLKEITKREMRRRLKDCSQIILALVDIQRKVIKQVQVEKDITR